MYIPLLYATLRVWNGSRDAWLVDRGPHVGSSRGARGGHYLPEFEWDEGNEEKLLRRHGVSAWEAEQCFANPHTKRRSGDVMLMLGMTDNGRMLLLVFEQKSSSVRVYSAREMTPNERRTYRRLAR